MSNVKDAVVKRIRALCEEKNIKPNELAKRAGLTPSTVYSIFNENRHDVNISTIKILCDGFAIGVFQHGMAASDAASTYTILTIGDGLVSQIPGLITSTATAIIITRSSGGGDDEKNFAEGVVDQLFGESRTLFIVGGILFLFALVPGLPTLSLGFMNLVVFLVLITKFYVQ